MRRPRRTEKQEPPGKDQTLFIPGCDEAIVGRFRRCGQPIVVVYDFTKLVQCFQKTGMNEEDAQEWVAYNVEGAWFGAGTPAIMHTEEDEDVE